MRDSGGTTRSSCGGSAIGFGGAGLPAGRGRLGGRVGERAGVVVVADEPGQLNEQAQEKVGKKDMQQPPDAALAAVPVRLLGDAVVVVDQVLGAG